MKDIFNELWGNAPAWLQLSIAVGTMFLTLMILILSNK